MPLPSSGGFIVSALLNVLEREQPRAGGYRPDRFLHAMIEAEKRLYAVRQRLGDPDFNPGVEERVRRMVGKDFAGDLARQIGEQATPTAQVVVQQEHGTTHVSAGDEERNAVALNTTVNDAFGSCLVPKGTGFLLNDEMDDADGSWEAPLARPGIAQRGQGLGRAGGARERRAEAEGQDDGHLAGDQDGDRSRGDGPVREEDSHRGPERGAARLPGAQVP